MIENKWALFYCLPNKSLEQGLKLIHTDNDVHSFFANAESSGKIYLYIAYKQQDLRRNYLRNMVWVEEDAALLCSSSSPFSTRIKRKCGKTTKEGLRKKQRGSKKWLMMSWRQKVTIVNGKAKMVEFEDVSLVQDKVDVGNKEDVGRRKNMLGLVAPVNKHKVWNYLFDYVLIDASDEKVKSKLKSHEKRKLDACSMSPHELVEWEQQEAGSPYLRTPPLKPRRKGLALDGYINVGGSSKHYDLVHENVVDNGHSLLNMDKERFSNNVVLDDVVTDTLTYTLLLVLKKKCRNKVNVTRKTRCLNNSKTMRLRKGLGKRVACGANNQRLGSLIGLNVHAVDDDLQCIPGAGYTYLLYNLSRVVTHTSRTTDRHHDLPPVVTRSSSCFLD
ncbi:hypothetical protein Tco_0424691 [Tanacetum coccineum]